MEHSGLVVGLCFCFVCWFVFCLFLGGVNAKITGGRNYVYSFLKPTVTKGNWEVICLKLGRWGRVNKSDLKVTWLQETAMSWAR